MILDFLARNGAFCAVFWVKKQKTRRDGRRFPAF
jgi:hypothetical protein